MDNNNKIYTISISEPWDFESPDGKNTIRGIILSIVNRRLLVFKANYMLKFDDLVGEVLILSPRLRNGNFDNLPTKDVDVNGGLYLDYYIVGTKASKLKENSKFVLIGSLEIQK